MGEGEAAWGGRFSLPMGRGVREMSWQVRALKRFQFQGYCDNCRKWGSQEVELLAKVHSCCRRRGDIAGSTNRVKRCTCGRCVCVCVGGLSEPIYIMALGDHQAERILADSGAGEH
eukprot:1184955-Amphidinium_carterae.4